jgi:chromosome segregation ATPase
VLLRARDSVSQVAQKVVRSLDDVTKAQKRSTDEASRATAPMREQISELQRLVEAHTREKKALEDSSKALRSTATARRQEATAARSRLEELQRQARVERAIATEREKRDIEEVRRIRLQIAERNASGEERTKQFNQETRELREQAALLEALNRENAAANQRRAAELGVQIAQIQDNARERARAATTAEQAARAEERAFDRSSSSVDRHNKTLSRAQDELARTEGSFGRAERSSGPFTRALERMGVSTTNARAGLKGLNAEFQGFQLALIIKYAQSLISALVALGAQFIAVAAAAGQAAIGIGAALSAGAAQAVPVVGVLIAAFSRLTTVLKAVKLFNQQQLTATHDSTRAAKAQATAADQIRSAEQRVADAHRNTARAVTDLARTRSDAAREEQQAQREVTQARKDAIRTVQDLMAAEEDAAQHLLQAQQSRQQAIETGDVMGAVQGTIDVTRARRDVRRAHQDAAPVRARGVEGVDAVQQAEKRLADTRRSGARQIQQAEQRLGDARRNEVQATQDLTRTRKQAADNLDQETAAADKLTDSLKQLSPAERNLYRRILGLQDAYRRAARPITDIITRAFTGVVDRVTSLLRDPRILRGFRGIATQDCAIDPPDHWRGWRSEIRRRLPDPLGRSCSQHAAGHADPAQLLPHHPQPRAGRVARLQTATALHRGLLQPS